MGSATRASTKKNAIKHTEADDQRRNDKRVSPTETSRFDEAVNQPTQTDGNDCGSQPIHVLRRCASALGNMLQGNGDHSDSEWKVEEECPSPGSMLNEPTAKNRPKSGCNCGKAGPGADGSTAFLLVKGCTDKGQASWHQKRSAQSLNRSGDYQLMNVWRHATPCRGNCKDCNADQEGAAASEQIANRTADQDERAEKQTIRLNYPLHVNHGRAEAGLESRQCDIHDRAVDEGHAGCENCRSQDPRSRRRLARGNRGPGSDREFIARWSHRRYDNRAAREGA